MADVADELDVLRELRARCHAEGGVFWIAPGELGVFDPEAAQRVNAANFADLTLPDKLADLLRGRQGEAVSWKRVRAAWLAQLRRCADAAGVAGLAARMAELLDERLDRPLDLVWAMHEVCSRSLVPIVLAGLSPDDSATVLRDQTLKLTPLLAIEPPRESLWQKVRFVLIQVAAGRVARRELRGRAEGRLPRRLDLTDPTVDLLPELGMDRAMEAVTGVLTAIAGPPGAAGTCLLHELTSRPEWAARVAAELAAIPPARLFADPTGAAPLTHRFVKETLRIWSPPLLLARPVRTAIDLGQTRLEVGQRYFLSPYLIHHDPRHWHAPDTFDPDRWLRAAEHGPCSGPTYVPFGWAPRACIGAALGTAQLILLCQLMSTRYRVELREPAAVRMALSALPRPLHFQGTIARRGG
jgi:cytochrome P450